MKTPKLMPKDQRKLRLAWQFYRRGQPTAMRVKHDDIEIIGWRYLCDCGYAFVCGNGEQYTVFDFTEAGLERGKALEHDTAQTE